MQAAAKGEFIISTGNDVRKVERYIEEVLDFYNLPGEYFGNILLSVTGAADLIFNNTRDSTSIRVCVERSTRGIAFTLELIGKRGEEFEDDIDRALRKKSMQREVFIIQSLADETRVGDGGEFLQLFFVISGIALERSLERSAFLRNYLTRKERVTDVNE
jgi:hypothetical protein